MSKVCKFCEKEMTEGAGCVSVPVVVVGVSLLPIPYRGDGACHDCGVLPGQFHHPGCDMEECPHCHGQAFSCSCEVDDV